MNEDQDKEDQEYPDPDDIEADEPEEPDFDQQARTANEYCNNSAAEMLYGEI